MVKIIQGSFFEEDYLEKSLGNIVRDPEYALTELVANAWDAGATRVDITIPADEGAVLSVEDNGTGMTPEEFKHRWMTLRYNRLKHQGKSVAFPPGVEGISRMAWGRNGIGRHGMLCFAPTYRVATRKDGLKATYEVEATSGETPFIITDEKFAKANGHGTIVSARVSRNLPSPERIRETLSARFVHDPQFTVAVNRISLALEALPGADDPVFLNIPGHGQVEVQLIDSLKSARTKQMQGFTFWVERRLVGEPSWTLDSLPSIDARTWFGKRYTVLVKCDGFADEVNPDWSGFRKGSARNALFKAVNDFAMEQYRAVAREKVDETKKQAFEQTLPILRTLGRTGRTEVSQFAEAIIQAEPTIKPETLASAIQAVANLHQSKSGQRLLQKLATFQADEIDALDKILDEWSAQDALAVLEEIDRRIAVVKAIELLSSNPDVDELHTLHPLVTEARWIFGPEYETNEYASNVSLKTAINKVFKVQTTPSQYERWRKRMDLFLMAESSLSATALDSFDGETGLARLDRVLLIELKRGGKPIGRDEVNQAEEYIEDIRATGMIEGAFFTSAFVVGASVKGKIAASKSLTDSDKHDYALIKPVSYSTLVQTASKRLFKLKERLEDRYDPDTLGQRSSVLDDLLRIQEIEFPDPSPVSA